MGRFRVLEFFPLIIPLWRAARILVVIGGQSGLCPVWVAAVGEFSALSILGPRFASDFIRLGPSAWRQPAQPLIFSGLAFAEVELGATPARGSSLILAA
jgi:hypothetical protein